LMLHCFEPCLHSSGLLWPFSIADVQHPLTHINGLRVSQHLRKVGVDDLLEEHVLRSAWGHHGDLDLSGKTAQNKNRRYCCDTKVKTFGRLYNEFLPTIRSILQENGVRRVHEVATSHRGVPRGVWCALTACRLLVHFPDYFKFS
jgi:hypothetical protein